MTAAISILFLWCLAGISLMRIHAGKIAAGVLCTAVVCARESITGHNESFHVSISFFFESGRPLTSADAFYAGSW